MRVSFSQNNPLIIVIPYIVSAKNIQNAAQLEAIAFFVRAALKKVFFTDLW